MRALALSFLLFIAFEAKSDDRSWGCGAGTLLAPKKTLVSTSTAATIDAFVVPSRPCAMTSGTSGCAQHDLVEAQRQREHFIASNFEALRFEAAIGQGEKLVALAQAYGCPASLHGTFGQEVRARYGEAFGQDARHSSGSIRSIVLSSPALGECL